MLWEEPMHPRRTLLMLPLLAALPARAAPVLRVGTLRFGSVAWELDVLRMHGLDAAAGIAIEAVEFAAAQATQVALQAGRVDMIVQDWLWVSRQRASGTDWTLSPTSGALGAVMTPAASPVQTVADLRGRRLGIAGSPLDKSWLLLRAYAQRTLGLDLDQAVVKSFGPPPLLAEQLAAGRLDAVLTYWPFAARAEAAGQRRVLAMEDAVEALGAPPGVPFLGWVFSDAFAARNTAAVAAFIDASAKARAILVRSDAEWDRIAPLTGTSGPEELARLRSWYRRGVPTRWNLDGVAGLYDLMAAIGGTALVGPATHLAPGTLWPAA
ncbi:MAG: ABC transporter substrate-binding protein [Gemmatimonadaceae bacterium]|nr:ABC transporter substrate-binding protein [Acetobacteraceae bacterium]